MARKPEHARCRRRERAPTRGRCRSRRRARAGPVTQSIAATRRYLMKARTLSFVMLTATVSFAGVAGAQPRDEEPAATDESGRPDYPPPDAPQTEAAPGRSEEHTSELQSRRDLVCRLLLEKKK